jgi:hypothetical protein
MERCEKELLQERKMRNVLETNMKKLAETSKVITDSPFISFVSFRATWKLFMFPCSLEGIASRDLHICFWYQSIDLKFLHHGAVCLLLKLRFHVEFFDFRVSA